MVIQIYLTKPQLNKATSNSSDIQAPFVLVGCFAFIVFRMSYCRKCRVAFPHGAVGGSPLCDCGIS